MGTAARVVICLSRRRTTYATKQKTDHVRSVGSGIPAKTSTMTATTVQRTRMPLMLSTFALCNFAASVVAAGKASSHFTNSDKSISVGSSVLCTTKLQYKKFLSILFTPQVRMKNLRMSVSPSSAPWTPTAPGAATPACSGCASTPGGITSECL